MPATVIIDNGSFTCKAGLAGGETLTSDFRSLVGKPRFQMGPSGQTFVGQEALQKRSILALTYPVQFGMIKHWDDMETLWRHTFLNELHVRPEDQPVLLTAPALSPKDMHEKTAKVMFENFRVPALCLATQEALTLYASGLKTGLVMDIGYEMTDAVPVSQGYALLSAGTKSDVGGQNLTAHLQATLTASSSMPRVAEVEITRDIKEKVCYVALDVEQEEKTSVEKNYELPDGQVITVGKERFRCPEILFKPSLQGKETMGLHEALDASIRKCDGNVRAEMRANIVVAGGSAKLAGIADRLKKEVAALASSECKVTTPADPGTSVWLGGSVLSSLPVFKEMSISKQEYEEYGPSVVHKKSFTR